MTDSRVKELAEELIRPRTSSEELGYLTPNIVRRQAVVSSTAPLQVKVAGGATAVPAKRIEFYTPVLNHTVWVDFMNGSDVPVIIGRII